MLEVNDTNFFDEILKSKQPSVVEFFSETCMPCQQMMPILEEISNNYDDIKFAKISVTKNPKMTQNFGIMSVPTILFFKDGKVTEQLMGLTEKEKITSTIDEKFSN